MIRKLACRLFGHHTIVFLAPPGALDPRLRVGAACLRCYDIHYQTPTEDA